MQVQTLLLFLATQFVWANTASRHNGVEFHADFYERSLETNVVRGTGNAWMRSSDRELWANSIEIDFTVNRATATGNVRIKDSDSEIAAQRVNYSLDGKETILDGATIVAGQMVLQGVTIQKLGKTHYDIQDGSYTNCNVTELSPVQARSCRFHWKIYGSRFNIDVGKYAHIYDVLVLVQDFPVVYSPYLIVPIKTDRQSGFLLPSLTNHETKGSGLTVPYYWAPTQWQDLEIVPTIFTRSGHHVGLKYRYKPRAANSGFINYFILKRRFGDSPRLDSDIAVPDRRFSLIGEWALQTHHEWSLGLRDYVRLDSRIVSDPLYTVHYGGDIDTNPDLASIRSQLVYHYGTDSTMFGIGAIHHQSLIASKDSGVDGGSVTQLPVVQYAQKTTQLIKPLLSFEWDLELSNFYRPGLGFDGVPAAVNADTSNSNPSPVYDGNDIIRTGQRLLLEPRIIMSPPMPTGFQFQPVWKWGLLTYRFLLPSQDVILRNQSSVEFPVSAYLSRVYRDQNSKAISHVIQPRIIYGKHLSHSGVPSHPFFQLTPNPVERRPPPLFDARDLISPFEYLRVELINRLRKQTTQNASSRIALVQLAQQYNIRSALTDPLLAHDPRYSRRLGPIDLRAEFAFGRLSGQFQASYQLETSLRGTEEIHESDWSGGIEYRSANEDSFSLSSRLINRADSSLTEQTARLLFFKRLPRLATLNGNIEYSLQRHSPIRYALGATFSNTPSSCWSVTLRVGEDNMESSLHRFFYYNVYFSLDFGSPSRLMKDA